MAIASASSFFLQPGFVIASLAAKRPYSISNGIPAQLESLGCRFLKPHLLVMKAIRACPEPWTVLTVSGGQKRGESVRVMVAGSAARPTSEWCLSARP
jgi:hypothetical protein